MEISPVAGAFFYALVSLGVHSTEIFLAAGLLLCILGSLASFFSLSWTLPNFPRKDCSHDC